MRVRRVGMQTRAKCQVPSRTPDGVGDTQHQLHRHGACPVAHMAHHHADRPPNRRDGSTATPLPAAVSAAVPQVTVTAVE